MTTTHEYDLDCGQDGWQVECDCGWERGLLASMEDAVEAWVNHCDVAFMEATERTPEPF